MIGLAIACYGLFYWYNLSFGPVEGNTLIRIVCAASFLISVGDDDLAQKILSREIGPCFRNTRAKGPCLIEAGHQDGKRD